MFVRLLLVIITDSATQKVMDISLNNIGDNGIKEISKALNNNKSLTELKVVKCGITAKGSYCGIAMCIDLKIYCLIKLHVHRFKKIS